MTNIHNIMKLTLLKQGHQNTIKIYEERKKHLIRAEEKL